ncbi:MAG: hypothetical protein M5U32_11690 [Myxococcota bacterium]|nr:hypothetical protein [Myxococcota bacterium]
MRNQGAAEVDPRRRVVLAVGDYVVGGLTGAATAAAVRLVVAPDLDMVLAILIGTGAGMIVHVAVGAAAAPLLGLFHVMVPGGLIGMYGGMLFAMRDVMQHAPGPLGNALMVGAVFGAVVTGGVRLYDRVLRDPGVGGYG